MLALIVMMAIALIWIAATRCTDREAPRRVAIRVRDDCPSSPRRRPPHG